MKILYSHLLNYIDNNLSIYDVSKILFQLGHENEVINDILDIEFTPNKGDCLSVYGLARDINSISKSNLNFETYDKDIDSLKLNFKNKIPNFCPKISFLKIEIKETTNSYKPYLEDFFLKLEEKKVNFFTDVSNYLAYELGCPTHCYDYASINSEITLDSLKSKSNFHALNNKSYELDKDENVFIMENRVINFAGIMGGSDTKCNDDSTSVLVECAFFNPDMIIGKTIKYGINSNAAYKFERGVDISFQEKVLRRFIKIVSDHVEITSLSFNTFDYSEKIKKQIELDYSKINSILGTSISSSKITEILQRLGFQISDHINIPSWRNDISTLNDIAEEIARVIGYNNIEPMRLKKTTSSVKKYSKNKENMIRSILNKNGFNEIINNPFGKNLSKNSIKVDNPLDKNRAFLRVNIVDSLITNLDYNEKRQADSIRIFEISDLYSIEDGGIISTKNLSVVISGRQGNSYKNFNKKLDKEYLAHISEKLGINDNKIFEVTRDSFDSKSKNKIFALEVNIDDIKLQTDPKPKPHDFKKYKKISEFPLSIRDISISFINTSIINDLIENVFKLDILNKKDIFIFDFYSNEQKNINKIGFRFVFQSYDRTLKDEEIDIEMQKIIDTIYKFDGVTIPGLTK